MTMPFVPEFLPVREAIKKGIIDAGARPVALEQQLFGGGPIELVQGELARSDCVIADVTGRNSNVYYELGLAQAMGKVVFLCAHKTELVLPSDLRGFQVLSYDNTSSGLAQLTSRIAESLREYRRFPRRGKLISGTRAITPFFVDWERLDRAEAENLCRELLFQMGYQRVDWAKDLPEFDLIAELPKKDPDGFEYRELWMVAMGRDAPMEMILEWTGRGRRFLLHRLLRRDPRLFDQVFSRGQGSFPVTLLFILLRDEPMSDELERLRARLNSPKAMMREGPDAMWPRVRLWDRSYLTSLVQQFPQLGFKYFSDEGRARSKSRKTWEELYRENVALTEKQAQLIRDLEDEKNRRVRAERDAVWKDISFAAAHKIGNPIFAIETDLDPLQRRILEKRSSEAIQVTSNIRSSVEKAKAIIDQFKSLTRIQEITRTRTALCPLLDEACRMVRNNEIECAVECPAHIYVDGDPERLAECFDELAVNATHFFDKAKKTLNVTAQLVPAGAVPKMLDTHRAYVLVHVKDNGGGVPLEDKTRIFDAFFTRHEHGTGLGLALVRRIVEGHGGMIVETGIPGAGADFEVYLPLANPKDDEDLQFSAKEHTAHVKNSDNR